MSKSFEQQLKEKLDDFMEAATQRLIRKYGNVWSGEESERVLGFNYGALQRMCDTLELFVETGKWPDIIGKDLEDHN